VNESSLIQVKYLDGLRYQQAVLAGCREVIFHEVELNKINFFPTPDKDTGSNLKKTLLPLVEKYPLWQPKPLLSFISVKAFKASTLIFLYSSFKKPIRDLTVSFPILAMASTVAFWISLSSSFKALINYLHSSLFSIPQFFSL